MLQPFREFTSYPVNGPSPQRCSSGQEHHLHLVSRWDYGKRIGYNWQGNVMAMPDPYRAEIGFASIKQRMTPRVPVHKFVKIPFGRHGKPDRSTIVIEPPAEITPHDVKLLADGIKDLGIVWSFAPNDDGSAKVQVEPQAVVVSEPHGSDEQLHYFMHSSGIVLAGLRLIATESVIRNHVAPLQ